MSRRDYKTNWAREKSREKKRQREEKEAREKESQFQSLHQRISFLEERQHQDQATESLEQEVRELKSVIVSKDEALKCKEKEIRELTEKVSRYTKVIKDKDDIIKTHDKNHE